MEGRQAVIIAVDGKVSDGVGESGWVFVCVPALFSRLL